MRNATTLRRSVGSQKQSSPRPGRRGEPLEKAKNGEEGRHYVA